MRLFRSVLPCILLLLILSACSNIDASNHHNTNYTSYVIDAANDGIIAELVKTWWNGETTINESAEQVKAISVNGKNQTVQYDGSRYSRYGRSRLDRYINEEVTLSFYPNSGDLEGFHYHALFSEEYMQRADIENAYDYVHKEAKAVASKYIDIDSYHMEENISTIERKGKAITLYTFRFVRYLNGYPTSDEVYMQFTSKGDIRTLHTSDIGIFDAYKSLQIDDEYLQNSIESKLSSLFASKHAHTYEIVEQTIALTPENQLVVISRIDAEITQSDDVSYSTGVILATVIDGASNNS